MKKAVLYARVSSKEQEKEGYSIPAQVKLIQEYADKNDFHIVKEFIDVETAKKAGREKYGQMMSYLQDYSDVRMILVEKTDRLYRNFKDYVSLEDVRGLDIHLVKENEIIGENANSHQKLIHGMKVLLAKNFIDNLSEETSKGMLQKAESGVYPTGAPYGYQNNKLEKCIEVNDDQARMVRRMYDLYATGRYSLKDLRKQLMQEGETEGLSKYKMSRSNLEKMLKNPFYYGDFVWKGKQYKGNHQPIVTRELWDSVQDMFGNKGNNTRGMKKNASFKFSGLMTCSNCGCTITAQRQKEIYVYYRCTQAKGACDQPFVREEELESQFLNALEDLHFDEAVVAWMKEALLLSHREEVDFHKEKLKKLQKTYNSIQEKIDRMYEDKLEGIISDEFWKRKYAEFTNKQNTVQRNINLYKNANNSYIDFGLKLMDLARDSKRLYNRLDISGKRELLNTLLLNCVLDGKNLDFEYKKPFDALLPHSKSKNWHPRVDNFKTFFEGLELSSGFVNKIDWLLNVA